MTSGDAAEWARLLDAAGAADGLRRTVTPERAAHDLAAPTLDLAGASVTAFAGEQMAGFAAAEFQMEVTGPVHRCFVHGAVHPDHRRRGLGTRLLREGVELARHLHQRHHPGLELAIDVRTPEHVQGARALYEQEGFQPIRTYMEMTRPLTGTPPAADPEGLRIEAWTEATDPEFMAVRNSAFQDHWGSAQHTPETWYARSHNANFRPELTFLARDAATGRAAGIALTHRWQDETVPDGVGDARIQIIATLREFRKRGVAGALIGRILVEAEGLGFTRASLYVDGSNPTGAVSVYEKAGFETARASTLWTFEGGSPQP